MKRILEVINSYSRQWSSSYRMTMKIVIHFNLYIIFSWMSLSLSLPLSFFLCLAISTKSYHSQSWPVSDSVNSFSKSINIHIYMYRYVLRILLWPPQANQLYCYGQTVFLLFILSSKCVVYNIIVQHLCQFFLTGSTIPVHVIFYKSTNLQHFLKWNINWYMYIYLDSVATCIHVKPLELFKWSSSLLAFISNVQDWLTGLRCFGFRFSQIQTDLMIYGHWITFQSF